MAELPSMPCFKQRGPERDYSRLFLPMNYMTDSGQSILRLGMINGFAKMIGNLKQI